MPLISSVGRAKMHSAPVKPDSVTTVSTPVSFASSSLLMPGTVAHMLRSHVAMGSTPS